MSLTTRSPARVIKGESLAAYAFVTPTFLLLGLFILIPMAGALVMGIRRPMVSGPEPSLDWRTTKPL